MGAKGIEESAKLAEKLNFKLKIVGEAHGFGGVLQTLSADTRKNVELLGRVDDKELYRTLGKAKGFIALARDEDFGMTVVEAQAAGTPVIAFNGGGFRESVVDGVTGFFVNDISESSLKTAIQKLERTKWDSADLSHRVQRFSKERFVSDMLKFINKVVKENAQKNK